MKIFFVIIIVIASSINIYAQNSINEVDNFDPTILILYPYQTQTGMSLLTEINEETKYLEQNKETSIKESQEDIESSKERDENIRIMLEKKLEFVKKKDFYSILPEAMEGYLQYFLFERFNNLLIYAVNQKSSSHIDSLSKIANEHKIQYLINFPTVNIYEKNGVIFSEINIQLFDNINKSIVLDKRYTGDFQNHGFEFTCQDSSIVCTFKNVISQSLRDIFSIISTNSPTIVQEKLLNESRTNILYEEYYTKQPSDEVLSIIISSKEIEIDSTAYYQSIFNEDKNKFISFFAVESNERTLEQLKGSKDKHINIISDDFSSMDKLPGIYAYTVKGVKYNDKWYIEKGNITYFNSDDIEGGKFNYFCNLIKWSFFKDESTEINEEFWKVNTFDIVESKVETNKKEIEKYQKLLELNDNTKEEIDLYNYIISDFYEEDAKNIDYLGMPKLVVNQIKEKIKTNNHQLDSVLSKNVIIPYLKKIIESNSDIVDFNENNINLIYNKKREYFLIPVLLERIDEKKEAHFYLLKVNEDKQFELYKWSYFEPFESNNSSVFGLNIIDRLKTITLWNYSFNYLEDENFWNNYVLLKVNDKYQYLERIY
jgi:hypothetical protein